MRALRVVICLAGVAGLLLLVPIVHRSPEATYGGADTRLLGVEVAAAIAILTVAILMPARIHAVLLAVVGSAWLVPEIAGAAGVPLTAKTLADASGPAIAAVLLVSLVLRSAHLDSHVRRPVLVAVVGAALAIMARLLLVDPFYEADCWRTCVHNPLRLVDNSESGAAVELVGLLMLSAGVFWVASVQIRHDRRSIAAGSTASLGSWLLLLGLVALMFVRTAAITSVTDDQFAVAVFVVVQLTALAWLAGLCWEALSTWRLSSRLEHLTELLRRQPGSEVLVHSLRGAVRDPGLRLAYWAPSRQLYVDGEGRATSGAEPGPGERLTTITRRGETIAVIVHSRRVDGLRLERALGPAIRLALENEQLRAAALAELDELERSRSRVVERTALERRRLERNLHDGAQQRAVSLTLLVRMLASRPGAVDEQANRRAELLTRTLAEELRRVARGIYPALLADAGLAGAVTDLAEQSADLPVVVGELPEGRYPGTIESTAYLVVRAGIADARKRCATGATITGAHIDGSLRIGVEDDALPAPGQVSTELADQVGALGGSVAMNGVPGRHRIEVVLPCVS